MTTHCDQREINEHSTRSLPKPPRRQGARASTLEYSAKKLHAGWRTTEKARIFAGEVINDYRMQTFIIALIAINAIILGIGTFDSVQNSEYTCSLFKKIDKGFLILFSIELGLQFLYWGLHLFKDPWLVFDLIIISLSWGFDSFQIVRAFRIFRALRLVTRIKVMQNLIEALFSVMPRMGAISLLLVLLFYVFDVMMTSLFGDMYEAGKLTENYFGRMDLTFFTLFQIMTLDNWIWICREVMCTYPWAWVVFIAFVIITGFIVVNLIIAVICDAVAALDNKSSSMLHGRYDEDSVTGEPVDVQDQLESLEQQMEEMQLMQEQTTELVKKLLESGTTKNSKKNRIKRRNTVITIFGLGTTKNSKKNRIKRRSF